MEDEIEPNESSSAHEIVVSWLFFGVLYMNTVQTITEATFPHLSKSLTILVTRPIFVEPYLF